MTSRKATALNPRSQKHAALWDSCVPSFAGTLLTRQYIGLERAPGGPGG